MDSQIAIDNADVLWNSLENANFNVDDEGRLSVISNWNLIGRLIKWISDWNGEVTAKVNLVVQETLDSIVNSNDQHALFYVHDRDNSWFFDAARAYSPHFPSYHLAGKVKQIAQFSEIDAIQEAVSKIFEQKDLYPNSKQKDKIIMGPVYDDPKILYWDEPI